MTVSDNRLTLKQEGVVYSTETTFKNIKTVFKDSYIYFIKRGVSG